MASFRAGKCLGQGCEGRKQDQRGSLYFFLSPGARCGGNGQASEGASYKTIPSEPHSSRLEVRALLLPTQQWGEG